MCFILSISLCVWKLGDQNVITHFHHSPVLLKPGKSLNSVLYDAWAACGEGNWQRSSFLLKIRERHSTRRRGVRRWLVLKELKERFGEELAEQVANRKLLDGELSQTEVRYHPEFPKGEKFCEEMRQFLTLVDDAEEEEAEESIDRLFSCLDGSDSESSSESEKKEKKKKKSKEREFQGQVEEEGMFGGKVQHSLN